MELTRWRSQPIAGFRPNAEITGNFRKIRNFMAILFTIVDERFFWRRRVLERYLGSRTRLRPKNSSEGVIFDAQQDDQKIF